MKNKKGIAFIFIIMVFTILSIFIINKFYKNDNKQVENIKEEKKK